MRKLIAATLFAAAGLVAIPAAEAAATKKVEPAAAVSKQKQAARKDCHSFLECLFGGNTGHVSSKRTGSAVPDHSTAQVVAWKEADKYKPGSIIVKTPEHALYYVLDGKSARRYKVGVGREGFQWSGNSKIVAKTEWPEWHPPTEMIKREALKGHMLPDMMEGGPENPLGARAMYIGGTIYRIHGTNAPGSIGGDVSSGCIRMMNTDVSELYDMVKVGARVYVYQ